MPAHEPNWSEYFYKPTREVMHEMRGFIDLYERDVLFFIFQRTGIFGKEWETIPIRHFLHGIKNEDGATIAYPVAMSKTNLFRSLQLLEEKRFIEVRKYAPPRGSAYRIRRIDEIEVTHALSVMRRRQRKVYESIHSRHNVDAIEQMRVTTQRVGRITGQGMSQTWDFDIPKLGTDIGPKLGTHNNTEENIQISNIAAAPRFNRRLIKPRKSKGM